MSIYECGCLSSWIQKIHLLKQCVFHVNNTGICEDIFHKVLLSSINPILKLESCHRKSDLVFKYVFNFFSKEY